MKKEYEIFNDKDTLILVVDMVDGFCKSGALSSPLVGAIAEPIADFLSHCGNAKIIFICDSHDGDSVENDVFPPHCHTPEEQAVVAELQPFAGCIVKKNSVNGTFNLIAAHNIFQYSRIVIVGDCTDICIINLALGVKTYLDEQNYRAAVSVIKSLTATYDAPGHDAKRASEAAYEIMRINGIKLID